MTEPTALAPISHQIWDMKYRLRDDSGQPVDNTIAESWTRVAEAVAEVEAEPDRWAAAFRGILADFRFLPAGRILAGAGSPRRVTLFNCFVMGRIPDDMSSIFESLREAALTLQQGGGIGYDFSTLRPKGALVRGVGADASGPLSFMDVWDAMCRTIMSAGSRRGAMMATLRCDHPDIEAFIDAKRAPGKLRMFNLSVLVTDAFMAAVRDKAPWDLTFDGKVYKTLRADALWERIMRATYDYAEPGVIFIDRINRLNNLSYCESINATNPCGEQPLPPYGACLLGSMNLARYVTDPFTGRAALDLDALSRDVRVAVRFMDNVVDLSRLPLEAQTREARAKRRIGLGVTGLADALILCGARYGGPRAVGLAETWMAALRRSAYLASADLAREKGAFPLYDAEKYLGGESVRTLDAEVRRAIADHGIRNALLTSIAPTGTISLLADNVSSGLEPVFSFSYTRSVRMPDGGHREERVSDHAYRLYRRLHGDAPLPDSFVDAQTLSPAEHLAMQAAAQKYIDSSISKTINLPEDIPFEAFQDVYRQAYELGCKGCTTYRPNDVTGAVLTADKAAADPSPVPAAQAELPLERPARRPARPSAADQGGKVHQMFKPLDRPEALPGATYKVRWPESDHAIYITLNDIIDDTGRRRPFEVFMHSKDTEHYAWTVGLTRMISAVFRRGGDVAFVVEELKAVFDPRGGHWMKGRYVPSLLAAIGEVIEQHMVAIGFLGPPETLRGDGEAATVALTGTDGPARDAATPGDRRRHCPKCGQPSLIRQEGCDTCVSCGYSKCG